MSAGLIIAIALMGLIVTVVAFMMRYANRRSTANAGGDAGGGEVPGSRRESTSDNSDGGYGDGGE